MCADTAGVGLVPLVVRTLREDKFPRFADGGIELPKPAIRHEVNADARVVARLAIHPIRDYRAAPVGAVL